MASISNPTLLHELGQLISEACSKGDSVTAIAARAGVQRNCVSGIKNGTYRAMPTLARTNAILNAIGYKICLKATSETEDVTT